MRAADVDPAAVRCSRPQPPHWARVRRRPRRPAPGRVGPPGRRAGQRPVRAYGGDRAHAAGGT
ncbi:MAG: hypothetical protein AVDCRST_MAG41-819 [uncultured Corynebacteriales bacterium]|uniref:Uncharacterized protein n=1 Tax=uncultured Mycobacteriales bacterium TaxID=581187 RepID=A0A6J4HN17_9ACTN|nr:MAG: hypothetical protein AVDCRST_MAG41-819 [uncultured Corynebacteriales bacterium]